MFRLFEKPRSVIIDEVKKSISPFDPKIVTIWLDLKLWVLPFSFQNIIQHFCSQSVIRN
jgi:hypothetical protein